MKTIPRPRNSLMTSLLVIGSLVGLYYYQKRNGKAGQLFERAKKLVNREAEKIRHAKSDIEQAYNMDHVDLDRNPAI